MTKPVFFEPLIKVTVVPTLKRNEEQATKHSEIVADLHNQAPHDKGTTLPQANSSSRAAQKDPHPPERVRRYYFACPALFQSMMLTSFQGFLLSWNSICPSLL